LKKETPIEVRTIDNTAVREAQIKRLNQIYASRDKEKVTQALNALTDAAKTGNGNLLDLSINASRVRATVGEISDALEKVYGRYKPHYSMATGAYRSAYGKSTDIQSVAEQVAAFTKKYW
jgi:methylmalonyl-CoA mutase